MLKSFYGMYSLLMCFSVPMMFELIPFDCSRMVLLAEVSAKWINFDYLSLTSFDFRKKINFGIDCFLFTGYLQLLFAT